MNCTFASRCPASSEAFRMLCHRWRTRRSYIRYVSYLNNSVYIYIYLSIYPYDLVCVTYEYIYIVNIYIYTCWSMLKWRYPMLQVRQSLGSAWGVDQRQHGLVLESHLQPAPRLRRKGNERWILDGVSWDNMEATSTLHDISRIF